MRTLEKLTIKNFKSIREQTLSLGRLNVFIGGNGVGKSNLIGVFRLLREIINENLAGYTALKGGADTLLHHGRRVSPEMSFELEFTEGHTSNAYSVSLAGTEHNTLWIKAETAYYHDKSHYLRPYHHPVTQFAPESKIRKTQHICTSQVVGDLDSYRVYHFHDTSDMAPVKGTANIHDNRFLAPQAENLPAFLYWMKKMRPDHLANIQDSIRQVAPFFQEFVLEPSRLNEETIRLEWKERGSDAYFNAASLSDGTLRFICLATLLMQPELPALVLLDEPELGLHPAAINLLAGLLESASTRTQLIVATQSATLVNQLTPESVWVADRDGGQSVFRHLAHADMSAWLEDYGLGELWEKNLLGGRP